MLDIKGKRVHFVGVGGIGMSAIAQIAGEKGAAVDGCDLSSNGCVRTLVRRGYRCFEGHDAAHVDGADIVVYSAAVPQECDELVRARELGLHVLSRSHMLAHLMQDHKSISILGSHGKTTTTWLTSHMLIENGLDPTVMLGGTVSLMNGNFRWGGSEWFVSEVDESDGVPEGISSFCSVLTNIDREHMESYGTMERIKDAFRRFLENTAPDGGVIVCADDANAVETASSVGARVLRYALDAEADLIGVNVGFDREGASFDVELEGKRVEGFTTKLPGRHNVLNALAAIQTGLALDLPIDGIRGALATCPRVDRRLHARAAGGITVVDDYGHHPTEIQATLRTIKEAMPGRLLCVFQPHRYTRTRDLMDEYGSCFGDADLLYILPVYPANESPIPGATSEGVAESVSRSSFVEVRVVGRGDVLDAVAEGGQKTLFSGSSSKDAERFSVVVFLGAGDIVELADELVERIG